MNPDIEAIVAELIKRNTDNIEAEIRKSSPYSSKINKYISSMEELSFYQRLCLQEKYVIRQSLIQPAINLTDMDVHGKTNYERMIHGTPPVTGNNGNAYTLHHMKQEYKGPFTELTPEQHNRPGGGVRLHPKGVKEESWRSDERKNRQFQEQRAEHWITRLKMMRGTGMKDSEKGPVAKGKVTIPEEIIELEPYGEEYYLSQIRQLFATQLVLPAKAALRAAEAALNTVFGPALEKILLTFGSLLGDCFETLGVSADNPEGSTLVQRTLEWRFMSRKLEHLIVVSELDDNYLYCCDATDNVYAYSSWDDSVENLHRSLLPFVVTEGQFGQALLRSILEHGGNG